MDKLQRIYNAMEAKDKAQLKVLVNNSDKEKRWRKALLAFAAAIGLTLLLLILTNPNEKEFEAYVSYDTRCNGSLYTGRTSNFLIFSYCECNCRTLAFEEFDGIDRSRSIFRKRYFAIAKNFIEV